MFLKSDAKPEAKDMMFRILGIIMGTVFLIGASLMIFIGDVGAIQILTLFILGGTFMLYGLGGNKGLSKVMPWLAK
ncbi:hypothetical protein [Microbulbifer sp. Q7]|uniref:hypothetical protein n=1 Tax=Microbulbifer sp. Q7 TaxID=1785091 RepID=UPI000832F089|nr:hypothetical protein [Microbulbifer sp. Q7]